MVSRRSIKERTALGRRSARCRLVRRMPVRLSVSAMEKKAMAATVSSKRGSAKRRTWPTRPGRCQAGMLTGMGITLPLPVAKPYPASCPGPVWARILSSRPAGTSGSGRETPATRGPGALPQKAPCNPGRRPCERQRRLRLRASTVRPEHRPKVFPTARRRGNSECVCALP